MKPKNLILAVAALSLLSFHTNAQTKTAPKTQPKTPVIKNCHVPVDSLSTQKITLIDAQAWADKLPLEVKCEKTMYYLKSFDFTIINMSPMSTKNFGTGNDGIPLLARRAIDALKTGDTVFLKDVIAKDKDGNEVKLPSVVFAIKD
ncbi:hypothetical protein BH11BAC2_BH11BAC2_25800 [soil metagenome]